MKWLLDWSFCEQKVPGSLKIKLKPWIFQLYYSNTSFMRQGPRFSHISFWSKQGGSCVGGDAPCLPLILPIWIVLLSNPTYPSKEC